MHLKSTVAAAVLLCTCIVSTTAKPDDGRAFNKPSTKRSGKLPKISLALGPIELGAFFQEQKLEDRLRLSKSYIKYEMRSWLFPTEDPILTMKASRIEELINCENLTLVRPDREPLIDCRPLEAHTLDDRFVSPVSDPSITKYVRRSSYRSKTRRIQAEESLHHDALIYPFRQDVVRRNIESYIAANNLGDLESIKSNLNLGYYVHADLGNSSSKGGPIVCTGDIFLSVNRSALFTRFSDDSYPEYADEIDYLIQQAYENGYLVSVQGFRCGVLKDQEYSMSLDIDFSIMQRKEFPYLFLRHKTVWNPYDFVLDYNAAVDQVRSDPQDPESYNTTVKIRSSSGISDFMNFHLDQVISNKDFETGHEMMKFVSSQLPIVVNAVWAKGVFYKSLNMYSVSPSKNLNELMNITLFSVDTQDDALVTARFKKSLLDNFSLSNLSNILGLDEPVEYNAATSKDDEQTLREEL